MVGMNKFNEKERRKQRRAYQTDHFKADLRTPKYRERSIDRKRIEDEKGNFYLIERYYDEDEDEERP